MPQPRESPALTAGGYFKSYETQELEKTRVNLSLDVKWQERQLKGLVEVKEKADEYQLGHEVDGWAESAHGRISARLGYTRALLADADRELASRGIYFA